MQGPSIEGLCSLLKLFSNNEVNMQVKVTPTHRPTDRIMHHESISSVTPSMKPELVCSELSNLIINLKSFGESA